MPPEISDPQNPGWKSKWRNELLDKVWAGIDAHLLGMSRRTLSSLVLCFGHFPSTACKRENGGTSWQYIIINNLKIPEKYGRNKEAKMVGTRPKYCTNGAKVWQQRGQIQEEPTYVGARPKYRRNQVVGIRSNYRRNQNKKEQGQNSEGIRRNQNKKEQGQNRGGTKISRNKAIIQ